MRISQFTAQGTQKQVFAKEVYTNAGEKETIIRGKDFTAHGTTTKGIDQQAFMKENLKINKVLGVISKVGEIWDVFGQWREYAMDKMSGKTPVLVLPDGGLSSMITEAEASKINAVFAQVDANLLNESKKQGIAAVNGFIRDNTHQGSVKYEIVSISKETASKILQGEIHTMKEFDKYFDRSLNDNIQVLYKEVKDVNNKRIYIIETFFVNQ